MINSIWKTVATLIGIYCVYKIIWMTYMKRYTYYKNQMMNVSHINIEIGEISESEI